MFDTKLDQDPRITQAVNLAFNCGQYDGAHHKMWVIDQMVRLLLGPKYEQFVSMYEGPITDDDSGESMVNEWDTGIAP